MRNMPASASSQYSLGQPEADTALAKYTGRKDFATYAEEHPLTEVDGLSDGNADKLKLAICHVVLSLQKSPPKNDADKGMASWVKRYYTKKGEKDLLNLLNEEDPKPETKLRIGEWWRKLKVWLDERGTLVGLPADQKAAGEHMTAVGNRLEHNLGGKMDAAAIAMREATTFAQNAELEAAERVAKVERQRKEDKADYERKLASAKDLFRAQFEREQAKAKAEKDSDRGRGGGSRRSRSRNKDSRGGGSSRRSRSRRRSHSRRRGSGSHVSQPSSSKHTRAPSGRQPGSRGRDSHGRTR